MRIEEKEYTKSIDISIWKKVFPFLAPRKNVLIMVIVMNILCSVVDIIMPLFQRQAIDSFIEKNTLAGLGGFIALYIAVIVFQMWSVICFTRGCMTLDVETGRDMKRALFVHLQKLSFSYYNATPVGYILSRVMNDVARITEVIAWDVIDMLWAIFYVVGVFVAMLFLNWKLALVIAITIPIFLLVVWKCRFSMQNASRNVKKEMASINTDFESGISGLRTAKAFANEEKELDKFDSANISYRDSKADFYRAMATFNSVMEFFMCILSVIVIAVGGALIMSDQLNIIDLITFSLYVSTFVNPVRKLSTTVELVANGTASLHRFVQLMRTEPALQDDPDAVELQKVDGRIDIDHVGFAYEDEHDVLRDVSLHIKSGETIAFVGSSGGGKTTLSQLIPRFYDVTDGSISVDGVDVRKATQESLHKNIGVVQQDVFLFADSIAENIRYGKLDATMDEIIRAAKMAEIYDDIMEMPKGFDTNVGERGALLSGGQKQRISIARIFLKNPPILILDEATSALDSVTEAKIQDTFEKLAVGRTTIIIAHRLSTVKNADNIVVIEDGRIVEKGNHAELMQNNGIYASLVHTQELKS